MAEYRRLLREGRGFGERHRELLQELRGVQQTVVNRPHGYWIAEAFSQAGLHAVTASWPADELAAILIATDGAAAGVEDYELYSWPEMAQACRSDGPQAVVDAIDRAEHEDAEGQCWPRYKTADDKALVYWPIAPTAPAPHRP